MAEPPRYQPTRRRLLRDVTGAGVTLTGLGLAGCETSGTGASSAARPSCKLAAELTEGPFHLDLDTLRRDITEDRRGLRLDLRMTVVNGKHLQADDGRRGGDLARRRRRQLLRLQPGGHGW
jgi:hypothetical protein